ncbi:MAG: DUF2911 domain-containing protein [Marinoscillum sp.]
MVKKILIGVGIFVVLAGAALIYLNYRNYSLSPKGEAKLTNGDLEVEVTYCRPSVRERVVFGTAEEGALQPFGQYWRLGANESTEITFNQDVFVVDQEVEKGTYKLYAIPGENYFEFRLNSELGNWGAFEADTALDVASVQIPVMANEHTEQFTISLEPLYDSSVKAVFKWAKMKMVIPIVPQ